jgi:hypothetical protein
MSENQEEAYAPARQEIEKLRSENSKLREDWLEATDALENDPSETHLQLVQELRKAAE